MSILKIIQVVSAIGLLVSFGIFVILPVNLFPIKYADKLLKILVGSGLIFVITFLISLFFMEV